MEEKRSEVMPFSADLLPLGSLYCLQVCHVAKHTQGSLQWQQQMWLPHSVNKNLLPLETLLPGSLPLTPTGTRLRV